MYVKKLTTLLKAVVLVCILASFATPVSAINGDGPLPSQSVVRSSEEAYQEDAKVYAATFGATVDEAVRRLKLQGPIAELDAILQDKESDTFAGLWIEHTPRFRAVIQLTSGGEEVILPYVQKGPLEDVVEVQVAPVSLKQLRLVHAKVIQDITSMGIPAESNIDLQNSGIRVYVTNAQQLTAALSTQKLTLPRNVQIIQLTQLSRPMANWYGGKSLNGCTSAFSVSKFGVKYSSTAGHCDTWSKSPLGNAVYYKYGGAFDLQVNYGPAGDTIKNWVADDMWDGTPLYREITSYISLVSVGTAVVKTGKTTGTTYGIVESNNHSYLNSPTWVLVASTNPYIKIACGGDSGAPVFTGGTAIGVLSAGWCDLSNNKYIAMPSRGYVDSGFSIMLSP